MDGTPAGRDTDTPFVILSGIMKAYYDSDARPELLQVERIAVLGYGIQGRAQALTLRDSGAAVLVGNREDAYAESARADGFEVVSLREAARRGSLHLLLLPDEIQPEVFAGQIAPALSAGDGLVVAHGFSLRYRLIEPPPEVDVLMLAPRMPGPYLRRRYLEGWGVPAFVSVEQDATGRARDRLLALAAALGVTRCAALEVSAAVETELDLFSEHFTFPLIFRVLEAGFQALVGAGYPPEAALMELHGSGELGEVLTAASREGLYRMIESHASPACRAGIALHWEGAAPREVLRKATARALEGIRDGSFCRFLLAQQRRGHPHEREWRRSRPPALEDAERALGRLLRQPDRPR